MFVWIDVGDEEVDELIEDAEFRVTNGFADDDDVDEEDDDDDDDDEVDDVVDVEDVVEPGVGVFWFPFKAAAKMADEESDWAFCCGCCWGGGGGGAKWLKCAAGIKPLAPFNKFAAATKFEPSCPAFATAIIWSAVGAPPLSPYNLSAVW